MKTHHRLPTATLTLLAGGVLLAACGEGRAPIGDAVAAEAATAEPVQAASGANAVASDAETPRARGMAPYRMTVYKSPTCGCCKEWVAYMREEGFAVEAVDSDRVDAIKAELGLSEPSLKSCHTAVIGDYVIEGHVPADDVRRLLAERPEGILGLTAPGMPMMSPGMASREPEGYDVLSFDRDGSASVWSSY